MNFEIATYIFGSLFLVRVLYGAYKFAHGYVVRMRSIQAVEKQRQIDREESFKLSMESFCAILTDIQGKVASGDPNTAPLLAGTIKACEAIAVSTVKLESTVSNLASLLSKAPEQDESRYPEDNIMGAHGANSNDQVQAKAFELMLNEGLGSREATQQAAAEVMFEDEKKSMISSVDLG